MPVRVPGTGPDSSGLPYLFNLVHATMVRLYRYSCLRVDLDLFSTRAGGNVAPHKYGWGQDTFECPNDRTPRCPKARKDGTVSPTASTAPRGWSLAGLPRLHGCNRGMLRRLWGRRRLRCHTVQQHDGGPSVPAADNRPMPGYVRRVSVPS